MNSTSLPNASDTVRLLVVDDHALFRRGLIALLGDDSRFEVVAQAGDASEALHLAAQKQPDMVLLDNHMPGVRGVDAIRGLKDAAPHCHVLMLTVSEDENDLVAALQAGADGYLLKTIHSDLLIESMWKVLQGESVVSPEMTTKLVTAFRARAQAVAAAAVGEPTLPTPPTPVSAAAGGESGPEAAMASLSAREREILLHIGQGASNKLIARQLGIAETTVKIHVQHILRKLGLSSRVQAAVLVAAQQR